MCTAAAGSQEANHRKITSKKIDPQFQRNNDFYHYVFEQATDAIMVTDFNGNFVDVNASLCRMFGYTREELLRLNVRDLLDPEHLRQHPLRFDILATGENLFNERKMVHKYGTIMYVEANAQKIMDDRVLVIARDISGIRNVHEVLKKSRANLQTIFDTTDTIYVLIDHDFRVMSYNSRAAAFARKELGHTMAISEYLLDYFPIEKRYFLTANFKRVLTGETVAYEVDYLQMDGSCNSYYVRLMPITDAGDAVYGLMMEVSDITGKKLLERRIEEERLQKQMEIADAMVTAAENERREIGQELHDNVNQLLTAASMFTGRAKKSVAEPQRKLVEEADKLVTAAIGEIRALSRFLIPPFLNEMGFLGSLNQLLHSVSVASGLVIRKDIIVDEEGMSTKLMLAIYRIVQEQLTNILKHAAAGTVGIQLIQEDNKILLIIRDDGVGFDNTLQATGIGFVNMRTRASLFKGIVTLTSSLGNGCELRVTFLTDGR